MLEKRIKFTLCFIILFIIIYGFCFAAVASYPCKAQAIKLIQNKQLIEYVMLVLYTELDPETGLYYYGARYYDPELGRFIQADTVLDGLNRYSYCKNNPVKYTDPAGCEVYSVNDHYHY